MSDKAKYAYLAGIIDGEGCLTIGAGRKGKVTNYNSIIMIASTNEKLIQWLQTNFGGNYYKAGRVSEKWKQAYIWRFLKKKDIEQLLLAVLPYLIIKREQAILLLEFVRLPRYQETPEKREELYQKIKVLNKRGNDSVTTNMQDLSKSFQDGTKLTMKIESEHTGDCVSGPLVTKDTQ